MQSKTIAMYIRLSAEDGDLSENASKVESNSVSNQRLLLSDYLGARPEYQQYQILEFCDDGHTGTNFDRPAFQEMMAMVKMKQVNCIIVKDLSRFGRDYLDVSSYLELILPLFGTRFISVNDAFDSNDYIGTTGGMELAFHNLINSMYSKDLSGKVKSARKTRERRGEYLGGHPFYGYLKDPADSHHLIVDESVREVVQQIFQLSIDGMSTMAIARLLNEDSILCPVEHKKAKGIRYSKPLAEEKALWTSCTVRKIIKDMRYTGKMVSNLRRSAFVGKGIMVNNAPEDWIVVDNTHEAIVSMEVFQEANEALSSRVRTVNNNTCWKKSGNLFVCGYCGRKLQKSNGKDIYLYCMKSRYSEGEDCSHIHADIQVVQQAVLQAIKAMGRVLTNGAVIVKQKQQADVQAVERELVAILQKQQKIKSAKSALYESYRSGTITKEKFIEIQQRNAAEVEKLEQQAQAKSDLIEQMKKQQKDMELVKDELRTVDALQEYDPAIIGQIVEKVIVYEGTRIELVMKNQDSYEAAFALTEQISA